uniref:Uncharacterized protein n=1 Tax=Tanacetum cinerariifolium TaxID=118510 RepID=A0A6L2KXK7_TANCI|nr:hypothetical protein [Tanacetum cinerariifolium]
MVYHFVKIVDNETVSVDGKLFIYRSIIFFTYRTLNNKLKSKTQFQKNLEAAEVVAKGQSTAQVVEDLLLLQTESRICDAEANTTSSVDVYWTMKMQIQAERHSRKLVRCHR